LEISYSHGFLFPSAVAEIRNENTTGLSPSMVEARGGSQAIEAYSTVSKFGKSYQPVTNDLSATEQVEALIEGSPSSLLNIGVGVADDASTIPSSRPKSHDPETIRHGISQTHSTRPTRAERFLGDPKERGGTVVVHYIKKPDWFAETMIAFLGTADEQGTGRHAGGSGFGAMGQSRVGGMQVVTGVKMTKDGGL